MAARVLKVNCIAPGSGMRTCEIWPKFTGIVAIRTEVVVDHIEQHSETLAMCRIDQPLQAIRAAIWLVRRKQVHAVISPATPPGKRRNRQEFDMGNAEFLEPI